MVTAPPRIIRVPSILLSETGGELLRDSQKQAGIRPWHATVRPGADSRSCNHSTRFLPADRALIFDVFAQIAHHSFGLPAPLIGYNAGKGVAHMDKEYLRDELTKIKSKMDGVNCQVDLAQRRFASANANGPQEEIDEAERLVAALWSNSTS
jgi:hypothetical protein